MTSHGQPSPETVRPLVQAESRGAADDVLVAAILRGDRKATAELVSQHTDRVYGYVRHRLAPRREFVDDLVQEVFLAGLKGLPRFTGPSLRAWLLGIARHKVEDHYRTRLRSPESLADLDGDTDLRGSETPQFEEIIDRASAQNKTRRIMAQLPESYALVLLWRYWERRSAREMAAQVGRSEKAIERLLARARAKFKQLWDAD